MRSKIFYKFALVPISLMFSFCNTANAQTTPAFPTKKITPQSILIQLNGTMVSLESAVASAHGTISQVGSSDKYNITIKNMSLTVDLSSTNGSIDAVNFVYPGRIMVNLLFASSMPNNDIYFDGKNINEKTDKDGSAQINGLYPEPGIHTLELKQSGHTNSKDKIKAFGSSTFKCTGKEKLTCTPIP